MSDPSFIIEHMSETADLIAAIQQLDAGDLVAVREAVAAERARMDDPPGALDLDERAELERLRREVQELRMDNEFLGKAAAFFASKQNPRSGSR